MQNVGTLARRELGAYFLSPIAYMVNAIFLFTAGLAFALGTFRPGAEASLRSFCEVWMVLILIFVLPMLTMRLLSEELRSGTIETLMTVPVTDVDVILGKFLGALAFYVVLLLTLIIYPIILRMYGPVDWLLLLCNFLGLILLGALYISVGLFFSSCTRHQVVAVLLSCALLALMTFAFHALAQSVEGWPRTILQQLSIRSHFSDFVRGLVDVNHVIFFVTTAALFLFLSVKILEFRRWR
ncbi:MAG: ABC transporter permease subunit [Phycisphaerales bacterium]|nr:MAG: ABC transporter permease subunit [Phycisphaerales bacterium]